MDSLLPLQTAIVALLDADPVYPFFDGYVDQGQATPYAVIGEPTQVPDAEVEDPGTDATITLHGFSRMQGKEEAYQILEWIRSHLDYATVGGWTSLEEFSTVLDESTPGEPRFHAVARYRFHPTD